ncbi:MATE family efflux transporter [Peptoniphilus catoniae]|uniref:MATE family efflux transporter n=1 Tax=Peptoniphilus catoniae TaxID=1660341 RepID=UPI0010FEBE06|nr:MATE family efflux transporter [Peptoniphilus catoniae]
MKFNLKKLKNKDNINLTEGSILSGIIYFAIPILLTNFLQQGYNTADLMIIGKFAGKNPMAAVGATGSISNLLIGLFLGLTTGASVIVSQFYGANDRQRLHDSVHNAFAIAISGGILLSIIGIISAPKLLEMLNTPDEILPDAIVYMRIFFLGITPLLVYNMGAAILRSVGDSKRPFNFLCVSAVINVTLDFVFVAWFKMSVIGAGTATLIAQIAAAFLVTYSLMKSERNFKLILKEINFYKSTFSKIVKIGVPTGIQSSLISLSNVLIQSKVNLFGASTMAGFAAQEKIDGFIFMSLNAIALASTTYAGQNIGARKFERLKEGIKMSMLVSVVVCLSLSILGRIFIHDLMGIFSNDEEVIEVGVKGFRYLSTAYFIFGMSEVFGAYVRGAGYAVPPMVMSMIGMCVLRIIWVYVSLSMYFKIEMIFISYPLSWCITFVLNGLYYKFGSWRKSVEKLEYQQ